MSGAEHVPMTDVSDVVSSVLRRGPEHTWLMSLVESCCSQLGGVGAGLAVASSSGLVGVGAATGEAGHVGEDLQFILGEGPARSAFRTRSTVRAPALAGDDRWFHFAREARRSGISSVFSIPSGRGGTVAGVLSLYRHDEGGLTAGEEEQLAFHGGAASVLLAMAGAREPLMDGALAPSSIDIRPEVHQAAGMVAAQLDVSPMDALALLRARAFASDFPLGHLVSEVLRRRLRFTDPPSGVVTTDP